MSYGTEELCEAFASKGKLLGTDELVATMAKLLDWSGEYAWRLMVTACANRGKPDRAPVDLRRRAEEAEEKARSLERQLADCRHALAKMERPIYVVSWGKDVLVERVDWKGALASACRTPVQDLVDEAAKKMREAAEQQQQAATVGRKDDGKKARYDLLPVKALRKMVDVLTFGALKYGEHPGEENWRKVPDARRRYTAAIMRHVEAMRGGEWLDPETGRPHAAHAAVDLMFIMELSDDP